MFERSLKMNSDQSESDELEKWQTDVIKQVLVFKQ